MRSEKESDPRIWMDPNAFLRSIDRELGGTYGISEVHEGWKYPDLEITIDVDVPNCLLQLDTGREEARIICMTRWGKKIIDKTVRNPDADKLREEFKGIVREIHDRIAKTINSLDLEK